MIGVFVTFSFGATFDEQSIRKIAETARTRFEGLPGLRSKAFTINSGKREATNFYVWDSEDAAKAFFNEALLERVAGLYGICTLLSEHLWRKNGKLRKIPHYRGNPGCA